MSDIYVESWSEFRTACETSGATVICPENAVWDMNDIAPTGVSQISLSCGEIQGNGTTIRNIVLDLGYLFYRYSGSVPIKRLNFENLYSTSTSGVFYGLFQFKECRFSGCLTTSAAFAQSCTFGVLDKGCSFDLEFLGGGGLGSMSTFESCSIHLSGNSKTYDTRVVFKNTKLTGQMEGLSLNASSYRSVIDADISSFSGGSSASGSMCLVNTDKCPQTGSSVGVTSEQLCDAGYLLSIGFPVGAE